MEINMMKTSVSLVLCSVAYMNSYQVSAVNLNYDNLSFLEKPIATHIGDTTIELNGLIDGAVDLDEDSNTDFVLTNRFQVNVETQLANSFTIGGTYLGEYVIDDENEYDDNIALYIGGVAGTASLGDVTALVQEETSRQSRVGNAELNFDSQLGGLADVGITYTGRLGPSRYALTVDEDENYSVGAVYQRPIGNKDYRLSFNYRDSHYESSDESMLFDSRGVHFVGALTYGSTVYDFGLGLERLSSDTVNVDRKYLSAGVSHKVGVLSLSAEAHVGDIEGQQEVSYAVGARYDIARGMSVNLGVNHSDSEVIVEGVNIVDEEDTRAILSFTYRF